MQRIHHLKMTPQRAAILGYLEGNLMHPTADDIYLAVRSTHPMMSLATVYNTLEALRNAGFITELSLDRRKKRYDPVTERHAHLACNVCGRVEDIYDCHVELTEKQARGYRITDSQVEFHGVCPACLGNGKVGHGSKEGTG